jgi:NAD-dependent SIR2 family protein deacetylase
MNASHTAAALAAHLRGCENILFLTGAGISTASGIADYRSPNRPIYKPLQHADFISSAATRQRYWARSYVGWPRFRGAQPAASHVALARLARAGGLCAHLITQNVDRLHAKAGHAPAPLELHGALFEVSCLACGAGGVCRDALQRAMAAANGPWLAALGGAAEQRPDGDVELPAGAVASFSPPSCAACGRAELKPDVVFYGGTIPPRVVAESLALGDAAGAVVVCGSTVSTYSAFRLVRAVAARGRPVAVLTRGATRADALATFKSELDVGDVLAALAEEGGAPP